MARTADKRIADAWKERLRKFKLQNGSVARFCEMEGVSTAAFYKWKKKLDPKTTTTPPHKSNPPRTNPATFAPVQLACPQSPQNVVVELPGGTRLFLPADQTKTLHAALRTLAKLDAQRARQNQGDASC